MNSSCIPATQKAMAAPDGTKRSLHWVQLPRYRGRFGPRRERAIMEYILDRIPNQSLRPASDSPDRTRYLFWWHVAQGSMMPLQLMTTVTTIRRSACPSSGPFVKLYVAGLEALFIQPHWNRILAAAGADLSTAPWFGGQTLSAADFLIAFNMIVGAERGMINEAITHHGVGRTDACYRVWCCHGERRAPQYGAELLRMG